MIHVWHYVQERYPITVTLPMSTVIAIGVMPVLQVSWQQYAIAVLAVWLGMFLLRAADDLHAIDTDRIKSPHRGLVTGRIAASSIRYACMLALLLLALLYIPHREALAFLGVLVVYYTLLYRISERLPLLLRPFGSNMVFAALPFLAELVYSGQFSAESAGCAGFVYLAAVAHEYAHNVGEEKPAPLRTYDSIIGSRGTAAIAAALFALSFIFGLWMSRSIEESYGFAIVLTAHMLVNMYWAVQLIRRPIASSARKFYILGFTFFILPLGARIVERLISWGTN
ncbi:UbiA family prenyltransferase [Paenibacillus oenotherae]|uniref:UbiA family prenyltransferase n=1 Tax=Paenibacillus oenotherae TaxID=1435645 RepID=A0ABS7DBQ5_9BACL|nr:UbiA family prenyltransferase [Paenibacillus oenotherae]MBW7477204.1 UbiA family prenyltransferase [Paenibacillus oenotherae]